MGVPSVLEELTSPFSQEAIVEQTHFYAKGLIDDQFFDVVKQGRLLMPIPIDNSPGDRNPALRLSSLRERLYLMANGGKALSFPVREFFAHNGSVREEALATEAAQLPNFTAAKDPSLSDEQKEKLTRMQQVMWVLFGDATAQQRDATAADIHGWDSPFGPILLFIRLLLFSVVGPLWKTWEYHVILAYFATVACQQADKRARALGTERVNKGALGRFLWQWSVIESKSDPLQSLVFVFRLDS